MGSVVKPVADRLWRRVDKAGPTPVHAPDLGPCWIFTGSLTTEDRKGCGGYGQISAGPRGNRRSYATHRLAYELLVGLVPEGLVLDHLCRTRACCNPDHLEPVTHAENIARGVGWSALNARKTHCPQGHPLTAENVALSLLSDGRLAGRKCRACHAARERARRAAARVLDGGEPGEATA